LERTAYKVFVGKPEGKIRLGRSKCRWEDIKIDFTEIEWEKDDYIHLALDRVQWRDPVNTAVNLRAI
jgi:hypothetical protein